MHEGILFDICEVLSVDDPKGGKRIKVRMPYYDDDIKSDDSLPYCFPLLPKMLHVMPKKGEAVLVILERTGKAYGNRYFIGPIISQEGRLNYDRYDSKTFGVKSATSLLEVPDSTAPGSNPNTKPDRTGVTPENSDVVLRGRDNADVILAEGNVVSRAGFMSPESGEYNSKPGPAISSLRYAKRKDDTGRDYETSATIIADRINLASYDSTDPPVLTDRFDPLNSSKMREIMGKLHGVPYGDVLVDFLKEFVHVFNTHTHSYPMKPPLPTQQMREPDSDTLVSKNIKVG